MNRLVKHFPFAFLAAWQQKNHLNIPIYSDSVNGQLWVKGGLCKTKLIENNKNKYLFEVIRRAESWLKTNSFRVPIYKWRTELWGEIPADFGRK